MATSRLTAAQRKCAHTERRPLISAGYESCAACGLIIRASVAAPWIIEYDAALPAPAAPDLFPARDAQTYIAESNAASRANGKTRRPRGAGKAKPPTVEETPAPYAIIFASERDWRWALALIDDTRASELELGGGRDEPDRWLRYPDEPEDEPEAPAGRYMDYWEDAMRAPTRVAG